MVLVCMPPFAVVLCIHRPMVRTRPDIPRILFETVQCVFTLVVTPALCWPEPMGPPTVVMVLVGGLTRANLWVARLLVTNLLTTLTWVALLVCMFRTVFLAEALTKRRLH